MNKKAIQDLRNSYFNEFTVEELRVIISKEKLLEGNDEVTEAKLRPGATSMSKVLMAF